MCQKEAHEPQDLLSGTQVLVLGNWKLGLQSILQSGCLCPRERDPAQGGGVLLILGRRIGFPALSYRLHLQVPWHCAPDMTNTEPRTPASLLAWSSPFHSLLHLTDIR